MARVTSSLHNVEARSAHDATRRLGFAWTCGILAFASFVALVAVLERIGLPVGLIQPLFVAAVIVISVVSGIAARTMLLVDYDRAGQAVPQAANALALAAVAAGRVLLTADRTANALAAAAGVAAASLVLGPALRSSNAATLAEWIGQRHGGLARAVAAIVVVLVCLPALVALAHAAELALGRLLGLSPVASAILFAAVTIMATILGGFGAISGAQMGQGTVLAAACLVAGLPSMLALAGIGHAGAMLDGVALLPPDGIDPILAIAAPLAAMMVLPPLLMRYGAALTAPEARHAGAWAAVMLAAFAALLSTGQLSPSAIRAMPSKVGASVVEAGLLAALFAAAAGFAFAIANALSSDLHRPLVGAMVSASRKLIVARLIYMVVAAAAAFAALAVPVDTGRLAAASLWLSLAGLAPVVLVGRFVPAIGAAAAASAMVAGSGAALVLGLGYRHPALPAISEAHAGPAGALIGLAALVAVACVDWAIRRLRGKSAASFVPPPVDAPAPAETAEGRKRFSRQGAPAGT
jgi:cation/acetate symporter